MSTNFFSQNSGKFSVPSIQDHPLPFPSNSHPFKTGHFPSYLNPENETGTPKFEILYFSSQNSVLPGNFLLGTLYFLENGLGWSCIFQKKAILCKKFFVQYWISWKVLDFSSFSRPFMNFRVVLSSPVPSQIFPEFSSSTRPDISSLVTVSSNTVQSRPDQNKTGNTDLYNELLGFVRLPLYCVG